MRRKARVRRRDSKDRERGKQTKTNRAEGRDEKKTKSVSNGAMGLEDLRDWICVVR